MSMEFEPAVLADEITDAPVQLEIPMGEVGATPWRRVFRRFVHNWAAMTGLVLMSSAAVPAVTCFSAVFSATW